MSPYHLARCRIVVGRLLATAVTTGLALTATAAPREPAPATRVLTFYHWWTSPSESSALGALVKLFSAKYPDVSVLPMQAPALGQSPVRSLFPVIKTLEARNHSPDAFQMYAGCAAEVFYESGLLSPIDEVWAKDQLETVIPPVIRDLNRFQGHYYSVPVNVHRTNVVWYNKALLEKYKIDPQTLTTWDAFFDAAQTLRAAGIHSPVQMGVDWTATTVFEGIFASQGIDTYEDWINGKITAAKDPRLINAFKIFEKYLTYVNADHAQVEWDAAAKRVMKGDGAFYVMGDWVNGEFRMAGMHYGKDYGTVPVPGTKGMFGLGIDTFQHPRGIVDETNSMRWLQLAASREGQDTFNPLKGSISARSDADATRYDPYQRTAISDLKSATHLYPTIGSAVSEAFSTHINGDVATFMADHDIQKAAASLAGDARRLVGPSSRKWQLNRAQAGM